MYLYIQHFLKLGSVGSETIFPSPQGTVDEQQLMDEPSNVVKENSAIDAITQGTIYIVFKYKFLKL
jgi:hypothetical protein